MDRDPDDSSYLWYTKTPLVKRIPSVIGLAFSMAVGLAVGSASFWWLGVIAYLAMMVLTIIILNRTFGLPLERLPKYREYDEP